MTIKTLSKEAINVQLYWQRHARVALSDLLKKTVKKNKKANRPITIECDKTICLETGLEIICQFMEFYRHTGEERHI